MTTEEWRDVIGYEGIYKVSNFGRVKNHRRIKSQQANNKGYMIVHLSKNAKLRWCLVHRLVAQAFIDNPDNKATVNHKDGNRANNNVNNLEWASYSENNLHSYRSNGRKSALAIPIYCIETGKIYKSSYDASRDTGISQSSINRCANGIFKSANGTRWGLLRNRKEILYV